MANMALPQNPAHSRQFTNPKSGKLETSVVNTAPLRLAIHKNLEFMSNVLSGFELSRVILHESPWHT
jgi:hypothetical protein